MGMVLLMSYSVSLQRILEFDIVIYSVNREKQRTLYRDEYSYISLKINRKYLGIVKKTDDNVSILSHLDSTYISNKVCTSKRWERML